MTQKRLALALMAGASLTLAGCEFGPKATTQNGYRGTGLNQIVNNSKVTRQQAIPANVYETPDDSGPRARKPTRMFRFWAASAPNASTISWRT